jgi:tight adherence protein C
MIYLILTFTFLFAFLFIFFVVVLNFVSEFSAKQNFYGITDKDKNVFLVYLIKISEIFTPIIKNIKFKIFVEYLNKVDHMLKTFNLNSVKINSYNFVFIQIISMITGCCISLFIFGFDFLFMICFGLLFFILPYLKIYEQYNKKINEIVKQIPDVANLLAILVYSGIDFNNSVNKITVLLDGTLINELKDVMKKIVLGIDTKVAFKEMAERYNIVQLDSFVKTITMSLDTGTGLTEGLTKIAKQISDDNVAIAEKKAHEAPVKMLLPMTILILPTIFILLFAPFVISFFKSGSLF